jgi:hypothetical protein
VRPLLLRLCALAVLLAVYLAGAWVPLRESVALLTARALDLAGFNATVSVQGDSVTLAVGAARIAITRACTYLDLALILIPFTWRLGLPVSRNLLRVAAILAGVAFLNVARLVVAIAAHAEGAGWGAAHDLPDVGLYHAAIAIAVMLSARHDWRLLAARRGDSARHG